VKVVKRVTDAQGKRNGGAELSTRSRLTIKGTVIHKNGDIAQKNAT
jgi:hypothetical protein